VVKSVVNLFAYCHRLQSAASQAPLSQSGVLLPYTEQNFTQGMKISVVSKKLWCVHKQLLLLLAPLVFLPLLFTLPEKVSDLILCVQL